MRRSTAGLLACLAMMGCGESGPVKPVRKPPEVGQRVILPSGYADDLWNNLEARRKANAMKGDHEPAFFQTEEYKANDSHRVGLVMAGDLVEVLEVGEDFAAVNVVRTQHGEPGSQHGYVDPWW